MTQPDRVRPDRRVAPDKITVLVASAAVERRRRWQARLHESFQVCEVTARGALEHIIPHLEPHVLILDLCLSQPCGIRQISRLQRLSPRTKIIALAARSDDREAVTALQLGARGYCGRDIEPDQLRKAVEGVAAGEIWIQRRVVSVLLETLRATRQSARRSARAVRLPNLTPREYEVAQLITTGARNREIAQKLSITERTVKAHLTELFRTLRVSDRLQLAVLLNRRGLNSDAARQASTPRNGMRVLPNARATNGHGAHVPEVLDPVS